MYTNEKTRKKHAVSAPRSYDARDFNGYSRSDDNVNVELVVWNSQVYNRIIALAWLHLLGAIVLTSVASVAALGLGWAPQFTSAQGAGAPLVAVCFLKVSG